MKENFKFIDLFAGIGGFRIALEDFGHKCVFSSEWDKYAQQTYKENFNEIPKGDITQISEIDIPKHEIICAGFPCQAFSISGKQKGFEDIRGTLFFDILRIANYHKPKVLFLENVKNLTKHKNGDTLNTIVDKLEELGYNVFYDILKASNYGVPQARERVYFVCFRKDLKINNFTFPKPINKKIFVKDILESSVDNIFFINRNDIEFWKKEESPQLKPIQIGKINKGGQGERIYSINGHGITLSAYGGGIAGKTGAYLVNGKIRRLTPRECARLQGFPDTFKIPVSRSQAYKQFGNSVSVPVLKLIFEKINKILLGEIVEKSLLDYEIKIEQPLNNETHLFLNY